MKNDYWKDPINAFVNETSACVELLTKDGFWAQAVMVVYSAIDQLAWLSSGAKEVRVSPDDFKAWVAAYMTGAWTPADIYVGRCAALHQRMSGQLTQGQLAQGQRDVMFSTPAGHVATVRVRRGSDPEPLVVEFRDFMEAFVKAGRAFNLELELEKNSERKRLAHHRAAAWLRLMPTGEPVYGP